jgi:hypothetical protein
MKKGMSAQRIIDMTRGVDIRYIIAAMKLPVSFAWHLHNWNNILPTNHQYLEILLFALNPTNVWHVDIEIPLSKPNLPILLAKNLFLCD